MNEPALEFVQVVARTREVEVWEYVCSECGSIFHRYRAALSGDHTTSWLLVSGDMCRACRAETGISEPLDEIPF